MGAGVVFQRTRIRLDVFTSDPDSHHEIPREDVKHTCVLVQPLLRALGEHQAVSWLAAATEDRGRNSLDSSIIEYSARSRRVQMILTDAPVGDFFDAFALLRVEPNELSVRNVHSVTLVEVDVRDRETFDLLGALPDVVYLVHERVDQFLRQKTWNYHIAVHAPFVKHCRLVVAERPLAFDACDGVGPVDLVVPRQQREVLGPDPGTGSSRGVGMLCPPRGGHGNGAAYPESGASQKTLGR